MYNYGGLSEEHTLYDSSDIVVIPVPYDGTSTWIKGSVRGPAALLEASANMELYDIETDSEVYLKGIHTGREITTSEGPEVLAGKVKEVVSRTFRDHKFPVVIGGEHSVSIGAIKAAAEKFENLTVLQLDAHSDLRKEYEGSAYNHACVMARAQEVARITQVGIRSMSVEEKENMDFTRVVWAHEMHRNTGWIQKVLSLIEGNIYITIDLDVLDPACFPATGTPEPGGPFYPDLIHLLREVNKKVNIVGFDVVELCPIEGNPASDFLAAKLIYQLLSMKFKGK